MNQPKITRRTFIGAVVAGGAFPKIASGSGAEQTPTIDRRSLVSRHDPILRKFEPLSPLSVGNGEFAFTCDVTGLQTFPELYEKATPLCTMSQWGWHTSPMPESLIGKTYKLTDYDTYGRKVGYRTGREGQQELYDYLRQNPHKFHLGQIGFDFGPGAKPEDITDIEQRLELWTGIIHSKFKFKGVSVYVRTAADPSYDALLLHVESQLLTNGRLSIRVAFPYGSLSMPAADWSKPEDHKTNMLLKTGSSQAILERVMDGTKYLAYFYCSGNIERKREHEYIFHSSQNGTLNCSLAFFNRAGISINGVTDRFNATQSFWKHFWSTSGAIELSKSKDSRADELERRVVLSQYLTAINCSGSLPPQETGLTCNSWYGKFHLEMHWWHAAHFALWNRLPLLERSLGYYGDVLPAAHERARQQGYSGARWPKMTSPDGADSPSPIGPMLIWQQPHPIFYAELVYLLRPTAGTLNRFSKIVFDTADFMASYAHYDPRTDRYILGPPVIPAQENHPARDTWNPTFELEYWHFGLATAQRWRERMRLTRVAKWDDILNKLSKLPAKDGVYLAHENCPQTFTERNRDHPSMLAALGMLPGALVDRETMRRTLKKVLTGWNWADTWGWDYPMTAMTAARLGETEIAVDALLMDTPKNHYLPNGHCYQRPDLPLYLPANGGLLYAVALMANGWKDAPKRPAPGFPSNGKWIVRIQGFNPAIFRNI